MPTPKHPNLTREAIAEAQAIDYARCRTLRHAWEPTGSPKRKPQFGDIVTLRCIFCGMLRHDKFSRVTGERIAPPSYDQPPGYRGEKQTSAWWRAAWAETLTWTEETDVIVTSEPDEVDARRRSRRRAS